MNGRFAFALIPLMLGCSSSSNDTTPPGPDASTDGPIKDGARPDVLQIPDTGVDAGPTPTPVGTQLAAGDHLQLFGVTSDNFAIYADGTANVLFAAPLAGGAPKTIATLVVPTTKITTAVFVSKNVVLVWPNLATATNVGGLSVWTNAGGYKPLATASSSTVASVSTDGTHVIYSSNSDAAGKNGDVSVANTDGTGITSVLTGVTYAAPCFPSVGFAGAYAVASHCPSGAVDGGAPAATVSVFTGATWTQTDVLTNALDFWTTDTAGDRLAVATNAGVLQTTPLPPGTLTTIDTIGTTGFGLLTKDGAATLYTTDTKAFKRSPTAAPAPATIVGTGVTALLSVSLDDKYALYYTTPDAKMQKTDMFLTSTAAASTPTTLSATVDAILFSDAFTADSSRATYYTNVTQNTIGFVGDLMVVPVTGGTPTKISTNVWNNYSATGTKVVFNDNFVVQGQGLSDIKSVDTAQTAAPTLIVASADANMLLAPSKDKIVYTFSIDVPDAGTSDHNGLYVTPVP